MSLVNLSQDELRSLLIDGIKEAFASGNLPQHDCPLLSIGINDEEHKRHHYTLREILTSEKLDEHKQHHTFLRNLITDGKKIGIGFILALFTILGGGILTILWLGFKAKLGGSG